MKGLVTMDINPLAGGTGGSGSGMSKEQILDKGIRQKSTKRVNSFIVCKLQCILSGATEPWKLWETACLLRQLRGILAPFQYLKNTSLIRIPFIKNESVISQISFECITITQQRSIPKQIQKYFVWLWLWATHRVNEVPCLRTLKSN